MTLTLGSNDLGLVREKSCAFQNVGSPTSPCKLTIYDTFDQTVLGEEQTGGYYSWFMGCFSIDKVVASGINTVKSKERRVMNGNDAVYNLAGQRVAGGYRGVVIQNGRKCIRR